MFSFAAVIIVLLSVLLFKKQSGEIKMSVGGLLDGRRPTLTSIARAWT